MTLEVFLGYMLVLAAIFVAGWLAFWFIGKLPLQPQGPFPPMVKWALIVLVVVVGLYVILLSLPGDSAVSDILPK